jgi:hypothetical protein
MHIMQSRRDFLATLSGATAAGVLGTGASLADEGPPEVTTIRLPHNSNICLRRSTWPRSCYERKDSPTSAMCKGRGVSRSRRWQDAARSTSP